MGSRRFQPLILGVLALTALVVARLFQVQVLEHAIWSREAVNLVRSSAVVPYRRGAIVDRQGRAVVRDEEVYQVQFTYRDFRRGHPLGQVAHAWSSLELRPVPLAEALAQLVPAGLELVQLTHAQLDRFAAGDALRGELLSVPPAIAGRAEYRLTRRADLRFYVSRLLRLDRREALNAVRSKNVYPSLLAYALAARPELDEQALLAEVAERLAASARDLERLAQLLHAGERDALVERLEGWRREVEDSTAGELFREAAGFSMGRFAPTTARSYLDLDWLAVLLRWDEQRLDEWVAAARAQWIEAFHEYHRPRLSVLVELGADDELPGIVSGFWAERYLAGREGGAHPLEVFSELDSLFQKRLPRHLRAADLRVLPFEEPGVRWGPGSSYADLARLELWALSGAEPTAEEVLAGAAAWEQQNARGPDLEWIDARTLAVVEQLEPRFQRVLSEHLAAVSGRSRSPLSLSDGRLDHAENREHSVLKDRGSRPFYLAGEPDYSLIHLVTRYPESFAGFGVRESTRRRREDYARGTDRVLYAKALLGNVRAPGLRELLGQRSREEQLLELRRRGQRDEEEISNLVRDILLVDEQLGGDGIEGHFETELSGTNGYRERRGMQELLSAQQDHEYYYPPEDGRELVLTLDLDLQRAAQDTLAHPAEDPDPNERDYRWLDRPTGAIVLARPNGDVLAAASFPDPARRDARTGLESRDKRDWAVDRTLTAIAFQPPGSVFKPFVAAWAYDREGLDPAASMICGERAGHGPGAGYKSMRCHSTWGHGEVRLHDALMRSCNGYFAWLGEQLDEDSFQALASTFGFGQPTGVRYYPERGGLREDICARYLLQGLHGSRLLMAGNGLGVINVTPMQVARAYAGLATGELPDMRLVERVGDEVLERRSRPLGLARGTLDMVRTALSDVAGDTGGSGYQALNQSQLGFRMCAKTGSADISDEPELAPDGVLRVRKHTWVAGWFPPENPVAVLVVFVDDTIMTASKSAVWIARQFLQRPEVQAFARGELDG